MEAKTARQVINKWNNLRAKSEKEGVEKFWTLMRDPILHPSKFKAHEKTI